MKSILNNELLLYPCPVTLVTSSYQDKDNIITISWAGIASSSPEFVTISIKPNRYSYNLIKNSMCFCINIITNDLLEKADYCGSYSGEFRDKFSDCHFNKLPGKQINVPMIAECPVNIECRVFEIIELGSHHLFIGKVEGKYINSAIQQDSIVSHLDPIVYLRPNYYKLDHNIAGTYGKVNSNNLLKNY